MIVILSFVVFVAACFLVNEYPYGPICLYLICLPAFLLTLYWSVLHYCMEPRDFTGALAIPLAIVSMIGIAVWIYWVNTHENWGKRTREIYAQGGWHEYGMLCPGGPIYNGTIVESKNDDKPFAMIDGKNAHLIHYGNEARWKNKPDMQYQDSSWVRNKDRYWYRVQHPRPHDTTIVTYEDDKGDTVIDDDYFSAASQLVDDDTYIDCLTPFLMWASPFIAALATFFYACIAYFLDSNAKHSAPKSFGYVIMFLGFGLWCAASLSGAGSGVTEAFFAFMFMAIIGLGFMVLGAFGLKGVSTEVEQGEFVTEMKQKYAGYSEVLKGLFVVTCAPLFLVYVFISFLNQMMRRAACCVCTRELKSDRDKELWVTRTCYEQIIHALQWEWTGVITYANYWGAAAMIMNVIIAKYVLIFLAWLIEICADIMASVGSFGPGIIVVTLIILLVGLFLFLLPPVPGVPIYLTGGMVLVAAGTNNAPDALSDKDAFAGGGVGGVCVAIVYTCVVSLMLKLFACTCQQKCIGETMKDNAKIKQMVGINSKLIRTMKVVLQQPGLNVAKCAILIGGPDWPTSVLCGILGLDLGPILCGTLPVFLLIVPTVLAGSFAYLGGGPAACCSDTATTGDCLASGDDNYDDQFECQEPKIWDSCLTLATVFSALAAGVQTGSMFVAAYYLEQAVAKANKEGGLPPIDEAVRELDAQADAYSKRYKEEQVFKNLTFYEKLNLIFGVTCMIISNYMAMLVGSSCFHPFALGQSLSSLPTKSTWFYLIRVPFGSVAMILFVLALISMWIFQRKMGQRMKTSLQVRPLKPEAKIYDGEERDVELNSDKTSKVSEEGL